MSNEASFGWAVLYPDDPSWGSPAAPAIDTIRSSRAAAMNAFVASWRSLDDVNLTPSAVWRKAYRRGWRLARVVITPAFGY